MRRGVFILAAALALGGCVAPHPDDTQAYIKAVQGSDDYRTGFSDGCETANLSVDHAEARRNSGAFLNNADYRLGWVAGREKCTDVKIVHPSTPSIRSFN